MSTKKLPKYCGPHNPSGRGYCWHKGKQIYFAGQHNTPESLSEYRSFILENFSEISDFGVGKKTVAWLITKWKEEHKGELKRENWHHYMQCFKVLDETGMSLLEAATFGPKLLKKVRQEMVARGWAMATVNERTGRIKTMFKWAASEEMVPGSLVSDLYTVSGLRAGRTEAPSPVSRRPVEWEEVEAISEHLSPTVIGLCRLQWLTGMRSANLCDLKMASVEVAGDVWVYRPGSHKNLWRGKGLAIAIGPEGQSLIKQHLGDRGHNEFVFRPIDSVRWHVANSPKCHEQKTRKHKDCFTASTMRQAVLRAQARAAGVATAPKTPTVEEIAATGWNVWTPYQLRHAAITRLASQFSMEHVKAYMGHASVQTTYLYSDHNLAQAKEIARKCG